MKPLNRPLRLALWSLAGLAGLVVVALLVATLALPGWITGRGAALAGEALGRELRIEQARFQPWRLGLVLEGVRIAGRSADAPPLFTLQRGDVALSLRSLLHGHLVIESLALIAPELRLARVGEGRYDIDDLIQCFSQPGDASSRGLAVFNLSLSDGRVVFDDRPVQRRHKLADLRLSLPFLSTVPADVTVQVEPRLSGQLDGVPFDTRAEALPFASVPTGRMSLRLTGLDLAPLHAYLPASLPLRLQQGRLDLDLALDFARPASQAPSVKLSGQVGLRDLALTRPDGQPLLAFKRLSLPLADVQPLRRRLALGAVHWEAPDAWLQPLPAGEPSSSPAAADSPWQFSLAGFELADGRLHWQDLTLDAVQAKLGAAAWPLKQPVQLDASLQLDAARLSARATLAPDRLQAEAQLSDLALQRLARWLPLPGGARLSASLSGQARLDLAQPLAAAPADRTQLTLTELRVAKAQLTLPGAPPVLTLAGARLDEARIVAADRRVQLGTLVLDAPRARLARDAQGRLNLAQLLPATAQNTSEGAPWRVQLAGVQLDRAAVHWRDAAVTDGAALAIEPLRLKLGALSWPATAPVPLQISAQLAALGPSDRPIAATAGQLQLDGRVALAPLVVSGKLRTQKLPLQLVNAYLDPAWGLHLQRAELGLQAEFSASRQGDAWQLGASGDLKLAPLALLQARVVDGRRVVGEDLLSWQSLQLDGLKLGLTPGEPARVAVREAAVDDIYARLIVDEQGRFNLRDLGPAGTASAPVSAAPAAPAASGPGVQFSVERTVVRRGLVDFSDRFIRPNYSARLSELQGSLGAFASGNPAMAPLTLRGQVAGTGLLEITGELNPGGPLAMDVRANATDIELAPLSPYAGKYTGYAIERGKLSTRLHYQIQPGGQLSASNQIILNQLTFGDKVDSPDATSLPVRFAVSLLKDRDGVIDVNLPVSGSISDPDFSVGGIVWKLILNLIGKALTSPFSLFSGSDAPEEAQVAFAAGMAELADAGKLDRIAQLLADKPGVQLTLAGWADPNVEPAALRQRRLDAALKAENAATPDAALKRLYQSAKLPNRPRNLLGMTQDLPPAQMRELLLASYPVDTEALRQLAVARAVAVRDALLARGAPNARIFLAAPKLREDCAASSAPCDPAWQPHVELTLDAH